jgi:hypothetical protein
MRMKNLADKKFNKLKVVSLNEEMTNKHNRMSAYWNCICDCGNECAVRGNALRSNTTKSCGCEHYKKGKNHPGFVGHEEIGGRYWNNLKKTAVEKRKLAFDITIQKAWALFLKQNRQCALTGTPLQFLSNGISQTASLDRIDSRKGYLEGNVQWIHKDINFMKQEYQQDYFIELCEKVVAFSHSKSRQLS